MSQLANDFDFSFEPPLLPTLNEEPAAKRASLEHERERRLALIWQQCSTVAKTLMRHRDSAPFHRPVDPVALKCPDYLTIIKRPMDLGTALAKLDPPKSGPLGVSASQKGEAGLRCPGLATTSGSEGAWDARRRVRRGGGAKPRVHGAH